MSAETGRNVFTAKTFCLITGASKGYGKALAQRLSAAFPRGSAFMLMARSLEGLKTTQACIEQTSPGIRVKTVQIDLEGQNVASLERLVKEAMVDSGIKADDFEQALVVHNAGSLGDVSKTVCRQDDAAHLRQIWELNLTGLLLTNHVFFNIFTKQVTSHRLLVNVSTAAATTPIKSWSLYCASKAARDMLFRTMALEEPSIRILNYAPGPIDTDMQVAARQHTADPEIKKLFNDFFEQGKLLSCDQSIDKLIPLLEKNSFDSGAHIDYYDI